MTEIKHERKKRKQTRYIIWGSYFLFGLWGYWLCGHFWPIVPASGDSEDDCGEADGMQTGKGNRSSRRKPSPALLLSITNPTWSDPGLNPAAAVWSQGLIAWAMARPFEVLSAEAMESFILWDVTTSSSLKINRCFGGNLASIFRTAWLILQPIPQNIPFFKRHVTSECRRPHTVEIFLVHVTEHWTATHTIWTCRFAYWRDSAKSHWIEFYCTKAKRGYGLS
jgi:hypothetical protein